MKSSNTIVYGIPNNQNSRPDVLNKILFEFGREDESCENEGEEKNSGSEDGDERRPSLG